MAEPFIGEIRLFAFGVIPRYWAPCEGQTLSISGNQALFSLLGVTYGGDGVSTFKLPDLRGRLPMGFSPSHPLDQIGGEESHVLTVNETPAHTHQVQASTTIGNLPGIANNFWGGAMSYAPAGETGMAGGAISNAGASQPHENMQPYTALSLCIALNGIYPPRP